MAASTYVENQTKLVAVGVFAIDFVAFTAGVNQLSGARTLLGVLPGDMLTVGLSSDATPYFGSVTAFVTAADTIKISVGPISTTDVGNPPSINFTVRAFR